MPAPCRVRGREESAWRRSKSRRRGGSRRATRRRQDAPRVDVSSSRSVPAPEDILIRIGLLTPHAAIGPEEEFPAMAPGSLVTRVVRVSGDGGLAVLTRTFSMTQT